MNERQKKSVSERMREWAASGQSAPVVNRAEFLNVRSDIEALLGDGWSVRKIWGFLTSEGRISYGLSSFTRDVRRLVPKPGSNRLAPPSNPSPVAADLSRSDASPAPASGTPAPGSAPRPKGGIGNTFRVTPTPNKKDLIGE